MEKWDDVIGAEVFCEGLAWGEFSKGIGPYVILDVGRVYVGSGNLDKAKANGRIVRVSGVLEKLRMQKAPKGAQGYGSDFAYYHIRDPKIEIVERVEWPYLRRLPSAN
jgi:hypothetical protein